MSNRESLVVILTVIVAGGLLSVVSFRAGYKEAEQEQLAAHNAALAQKEAEYREKEKELSENANLAWAKEAEARAALDRAVSDNGRLVDRVREFANRNAAAARKTTGPCAPIAEAKAKSDALAAEGAELLAEVTSEYGKVVVQVDTLIDLQAPEK